MAKESSPSAWWLSQRLLTKSLEMAFEDPQTAMKLANLAAEASLRFGGDFNPHAAAEVLRRSRKRGRSGSLPPVMERKPEPAKDEG